MATRRSRLIVKYSFDGRIRGNQGRSPHWQRWRAEWKRGNSPPGGDRKRKTKKALSNLLLKGGERMDQERKLIRRMRTRSERKKDRFAALGNCLSGGGKEIRGNALSILFHQVHRQQRAHVLGGRREERGFCTRKTTIDIEGILGGGKGPYY